MEDGEAVVQPEDKGEEVVAGRDSVAPVEQHEDETAEPESEEIDRNEVNEVQAAEEPAKVIEESKEVNDGVDAQLEDEASEPVAESEETNIAEVDSSCDAVDNAAEVVTEIEEAFASVEADVQPEDEAAEPGTESGEIDNSFEAVGQPEDEAEDVAECQEIGSPVEPVSEEVNNEEVAGDSKEVQLEATGEPEPEVAESLENQEPIFDPPSFVTEVEVHAQDDGEDHAEELSEEEKHKRERELEIADKILSLGRSSIESQQQPGFNLLNIKLNYCLIKFGCIKFVTVKLFATGIIQFGPFK